MSGTKWSCLASLAGLALGLVFSADGFCSAAEAIPAFPGAEGSGRYATGGRGGDVYEVTELTGNGPGTILDAVSAGNRTIVFRVSGTIELGDELLRPKSNTTIAGQTAPGDGILLRGAGIAIFTHDVLIQHLRVRTGSEGSIDPSVNDAIAIMGAHGAVSPGAHHVVIDHVSTGWSEDEVISVWYGAHHVTVSWSILAEALDRGVIAGAAVDVVSTEPIRADNPLLKAGNCIITPHIAWASLEARRRLMQTTAENIGAFLLGKPRNVVN